MQLNELRKDLEFNAELLSLVETLKNVAGAQYHVLEKQKERFDEFMDAVRFKQDRDNGWVSKKTLDGTWEDLCPDCR